MRKADSYRGARRNKARADRKIARAENRPGDLVVWRRTSVYANRANVEAKLNERHDMANRARQFVGIAMAKAGPLAIPSMAVAAFFDFYRAQPRSRVVNRIVRELHRQMPAVRKAA